MALALTGGELDRTRDELAFLPAALEIVETPPAPLAGAVSTSIILIFLTTIVWASLGRIDIVASAPGKIVPTDRTKVIQPFETSVVGAIHVTDGQAVKAGDTLIELDQTMNEAETNHLRSDLITARLDMARLSAALAEPADPLEAFVPPPEASSAQVAAERQLLAHQAGERRAKLAAFDAQKAQKAAELNTTTATIAKLEAVIPVLQQRVDIKQTLYSRQVGSKANYLEIYQSLVEAQQDLLVQRSHATEAEAAIAAITQGRGQAEAEYRKNLSSDFVEAQRKASGLAEDLIKSEKRTRLQVLTAPIDGTVQQLAVHTVGGVVTPGQSLLVVVPADNHLEVEAMVPNHDVGFIHKGQDVEIKVDTFNFTRYGLLHGRVLSVSHDAITRDKAPEKDTSPNALLGTTTATSEPKGQELVFAARISLDQTKMQIDENEVALTPGMAVTAEIKTGERTVLNYFLSPLLQSKHEGLRER
ncbi:MAG TPA: HlyD family type I secretion periplasmic adaptor subunit [Methylocella sp.]|nr:HlyD family type I secretion periplasmic adaptor subunit [Methylocella sp.]